MEDKQLYEVLNQIKKEILDQVESYHVDTNKKFDKLFTAHDQHKIDISEIKTHLAYTREKFEEVRGIIEKEVALLWKELTSQKSELIHIIDQSNVATKQSYKNDLENYRNLWDAKFGTFCNDLKELEQSIQLSNQINTGRFWKVVAISLISGAVALVGQGLVRYLLH